MKIEIGIADDHTLFRQSLSTIIDTTFANFKVVLQASNSTELISQLDAGIHPSILLLDVNMGESNGITTAGIIAGKYPDIYLAALSSYDSDQIIISMLKAGCCAYLHKSIDQKELERALEEIHTVGYYNGDVVNVRYRRLLLHTRMPQYNITEREMEFLRLASSDRTYKQIASEMKLAERTVDGYREALFEKLKVQSRVGMVMEAIRNGWVNI